MVVALRQPGFGEIFANRCEQLFESRAFGGSVLVVGQLRQDRTTDQRQCLDQRILRPGRVPPVEVVRAPSANASRRSTSTSPGATWSS